MKLPISYYSSLDVVDLAKDLLGKEIFTNIDGKLTSGIISETEAYAGINDKASHAYGGRFTERTKTMYQQGGVSYVYLCYGIHNLFNVVVASEGIPHAVLIRGIIPNEGKVLMLERTAKKDIKNIGNGPGKLSKALGINIKHNNEFLNGETLWIEEKYHKLNAYTIEISKRIGIDYAAEDAHLPYRFNLKKA